MYSYKIIYRLIGKWILKGDLDIYAKTASKYDDCCLLKLPELRFEFVVRTFY